jgi:uncharacterized protein YkwD
MSTRTRPSALGRAVAAGLLVAALAVTSETTLAAVPDAGPALGPVQPTTARLSGIDASDRAAVTGAWRTMIASRQGSRSDWTGHRVGCHAGRPSPESTRTILDGINFARQLAGLHPVRFARSLSARAQEAALIMAANGTLSHHVPRSWSCWSRVGAAAAGRSNLSYGARALRPEDVVPSYLTDPGSGNVAVGHRRWILNPAASAFGNGLTTTSHALYVVGPTSTRSASPAWVPWPTAGWFPSGLEPGGRWSLASGSESANFSRARVRVERDGTRLAVHRHPFVRGFGMPTIAWDIDGAVGPGTYTVTVTGIRGAAARTTSYTVQIFDPLTGS